MVSQKRAIAKPSKRIAPKRGKIGLRGVLVVPFVLQIVAAVGWVGYLCEVVSQNWHKSAEEIKQATIDDLRSFIEEPKVFDDITLLVLKQQENLVDNL